MGQRPDLFRKLDEYDNPEVPPISRSGTPYWTLTEWPGAPDTYAAVIFDPRTTIVKPLPLAAEAGVWCVHDTRRDRHPVRPRSQPRCLGDTRSSLPSNAGPLRRKLVREISYRTSPDANWRLTDFWLKMASAPARRLRCPSDGEYSSICCPFRIEWSATAGVVSTFGSSSSAVSARHFALSVRVDSCLQQM